jgi:hypothetical protein
MRAERRRGVKEVDHGICRVTFTPYDLRRIDLEQRTVHILGNPFSATVSPVFWVRRVTHVSGPDRSSVAEREESQMSLRCIDLIV